MFDEGQELHTPYHRTKFEAEKLVREKVQGAWRVYRPAVVVGNSKTGEMDKIDGPYYFFKVLQKLRNALPQWAPLVSIEWGWTNLVPVDYVAAAIDHIAHEEGYDGQAFHIVDPKGIRAGEAMNTFARAGHAPQRGDARRQEAHGHAPEGRPELRDADPGAQGRAQVGARPTSGSPTRSSRTSPSRPSSTRATPSARWPAPGSSCPPLDSYAYKLWDYWERNLDPDLFKDRSFEGAVNGRTVVITGASSGIGRAAALKIAAAGGVPILVARSLRQARGGQARRSSRAGGTAYAYTADLSDNDSIDAAVEKILSDHAAVDMLVNNAGRSIRRSVMLSIDRFHDYERTIKLNYLGTIKLILGAAAAHEGARLRPHRQRLLDRRADQPAALLAPTWRPRRRWTRSRAWCPRRRSATTSPSRRSTCRSCARR